MHRQRKVIITIGKFIRFFFRKNSKISTLINIIESITVIRDVAESTDSREDCVESINSCAFPKIKNRASPMEKALEKSTVRYKNRTVSCFRLFLCIKVLYTPDIHYTGKLNQITGDAK